ncbi:hypothetical protein M758_2G176600 [Ceratodon purpureus]|nr:hypothetical protein M758_2G176600 [Ceratodon purpureus]
MTTASWPMIVCDGILTDLLTRLTGRPSNWEANWNGTATGGTLHTTSVIADIENARLASPLWRDIIDESQEWAMIRLSRWDYSNEVGVVWEPYEDYVVNRFFLLWETFNSSWTLATPIACPRIRMDPMGWLTETELSVLRSHLWDLENMRISVEEGGTLRHARGIWVAPRHRS